jgi:hypothetical protein
MVRTLTFEELVLDIPEGSTRCGRGQAPHENAPPHPPVSLEQLMAMQNDLMSKLVDNDDHHRAERLQPRRQERDSLYSDFLAIQPRNLYPCD